MDPPLDPPFRATFAHPGRTLTFADAHGTVANYLYARQGRLEQQGGAAAGDDGGAGAGAGDHISAPLGKLMASLKEAAEREVTQASS